MRLGATLVHLSDAAPYPVARWAQRLVAAGFESLWAPHLVGRGSLVPDPFVALAAAATATADVEVATATVQVPLFHPAELAHRVLSLRAVCGDRLTVGVSPGSTETDYRTVDRPFGDRFTTFRQNLDRLRPLLADGADEQATIAPGVFKAGGPKLLLGSWGVNVERAAREFDGWLASGYRSTVDDILAAHDRYRAAGGHRAVVCAIPVDRPGDLWDTGQALRRYAQAGFDDAVVLIGPDGPSPEQVRELYDPS